MKFAKTILDKKIEAFVMYKTTQIGLTYINFAQKAYIDLLIAKKMKIFNKYSDFFNVFPEEKALVLLQITKLNQHTIIL